MRTFRYIYITGIVAVLAIVGCGRGTDEKGLTHEEVRAINERVLECRCHACVMPVVLRLPML